MSDLGKTDTWVLPARDGELTVTGTLLGESSSQSMKHSAHYGEFARKKPECDCGMRSCPQCRCSACRWIEFQLFREREGYVLHRAGPSLVPGETTWYGLDRISTAREVISVLTTRRRDRDRPFLTVPADRLLAQASTFDDDLRDVYDRAVA